MQIQHFKEVSQTDYVPGFPLAAAWILRSTSIMICVELSTFLSTKSVEDCISVEKLNTLNTDLHQFYKTSINFQPVIPGLFSLIPKAVAHMNFALNFVGVFRT